MEVANYIIVHGWAHRLMPNNSIQSTKAVATKEEVRIDYLEWQERGHDSMDLTGADEAEIRSQLQRLNTIFFDNSVRVPTSEQPVVQ